MAPSGESELAARRRVLNVLRLASEPTDAIEAAEFLRCYDLQGIHSIVDVHGGSGRFLARLLRARTDLRGALLDRPRVVGAALSVLRSEGVLDRCTAVPADGACQPPAGYDAYLLRHVLRDCDDRMAFLAVRGCRRAMRPRDRLLVVERPSRRAAPGSGGSAAEGWPRTPAQIRSLLESAGLRVRRASVGPDRLTVFDARAAG